MGDLMRDYEITYKPFGVLYAGEDIEKGDPLTKEGEFLFKIQDTKTFDPMKVIGVAYEDIRYKDKVAMIKGRDGLFVSLIERD